MRYILLFICMIPGLQGMSQASHEFYKPVQQWFTAWELVSRHIYHVNQLRPVSFVFFDDTYVYSTSGVTVPQGELVRGPGLMNHSFRWKRMLHHDSLRLPDKQVVPVGLMSFASEMNGEGNVPFFVMPLPSFWEKSGVTSKELGTTKLVTGVFTHEFSHSQQMQNFGKKMTEFEKNNHFETEFSDDIIQHLFAKDGAYVQAYTKEAETFYAAALAKDKDSTVFFAKQALALMQQRQATYISNKEQPLTTIDNFFLTMEGLGQYSIYAWLIHPQGGRVPAPVAVAGVRRGKKWWSQDEGLALFLVLEKLAPPAKWGPVMFSERTESIVDLLKSELDKY